MTQSIRAVYEQGHLRLLEPLHLSEGQEIQVLILAGYDRVREALSDMLVVPAAPPEPLIDEAALVQELDAHFSRAMPLSATIIAERDEGP
ncbi:MAG: hypothetical protein GFH27_549279n48 [Chloroflexi bacterium AL-W]|nr:hypothetical protein [Chloroflexi bacterium AL-N1]NOK71059.1 hypothetical protein [Chloroflexi bacterium AL-N10]NOK72719.1 hypothetical protein [Chloroflexi bacterium AL-N5]NOK79193.1 hypothetical protein [Chloroflexi bacterium AL-W]NOK87109.1 hypothetical protein [Chloroflexi bacterium AL-N15]